MRFKELNHALIIINKSLNNFGIIQYSTISRYDVFKCLRKMRIIGAWIKYLIILIIYYLLF